jgi:hypothetical protein
MLTNADRLGSSVFHRCGVLTNADLTAVSSTGVAMYVSVDSRANGLQRQDVQE